MDKKRIVVLLVLVALIIMGVTFLGKKEVDASDLTKKDIEMLEEYCLNEFQMERDIRFSHVHGGNGTLNLCVEESDSKSGDHNIQNIRFLPGTFEWKNHDSEKELTLYFGVDAYCLKENKPVTVYSSITLTSPSRQNGQLIWSDAVIEAIVDMGPYTYYRFSDEENDFKTGYQLSEDVLGK